MPDYFEQERLNSADLIENSANRVPVCICIDASYSMQQEQRMLHVNNGVRHFIDSSRDDPYACDSIDLCIVTFGGEQAQVLQPFQNVKNIQFHPIRPSGGTPLGHAVGFAIDQIEERQEVYRSSGITSFRPWLIIMSDGGADDDISAAANRLRRLQRERALQVKCIGLGNGEETADLRRFSADGRVDPIGALEIENFFAMLSRSAAGLSSSIPGVDDTGLNNV